MILLTHAHGIPGRWSGFAPQPPCLPASLGLLILALFFQIACPLSAQPYVAGETYFGRNQYIEYRAGELPLVLIAGHGGDLTPAEIPDRTAGVFAVDTLSRELAIACYDALFARTGLRPHLVVCHLKRRKLDVNRPLPEAAQGDPLATKSWEEFHGYITAARSASEATYGHGLVIDIHGHGHPIPRLELGYNLGAPELNLPDAGLDHPVHLWNSSLRTLAVSRPGVPFSTLVRGTGSLGDLFDRAEVPAWPSPRHPHIGDAAFFRGGHITRLHSCMQDDGPLHAVQIETHFRGVRDTPEARARFATTFAEVVLQYLKINYNYTPPAFIASAASAPATGSLADSGCEDACSLRQPALDASAPSVRLVGAPAAGRWPDTSGHQRHATLIPAGAGPSPLPAASGRPALAFDGVDDTAALPRFTIAPSGAFSLAFSFRFERAGGIEPAPQTLAAHGDGSSLLVQLLSPRPGASPVIRTRLPGLAPDALDLSPPLLNRSGWRDGRWRHYLLSVDASGAARVYLDGSRRAKASGVTTPLTPERLLWLGWQPGPAPAATFLRGALTDVRLYPRALPAPEAARVARGD